MATNISKNLAFDASVRFYGSLYKYKIFRFGLVISKKIIIKITNIVRIAKIKFLEGKKTVDISKPIPVFFRRKKNS